MANILVVSWSALPYTKTASAFLAEDLKKVLSNHNVFLIGEGPDNTNDNNNFYVNTQIKYDGKGKRFLRPLRLLKIRKVKKLINRIICEQNIDSIIGIYPDEIFQMAGYLASKEHKIKFIPYFHNTYLENVFGLNVIPAKRIHSKIFESPEILVISDGLKNFYEKKYSNKFTCLRHYSFEEKLHHETLKRDSNSDINFFFVGTINDSNLDATRFFCEQIKGSKIKLNISSSISKEQLLRNGIINENVNYLGFVQDLSEEYGKNDFMLLTHGFKGEFSDAEYQTIFPTKTVEMLRSGRPIVCFSPENSFLTEFIRERNCAKIYTTKAPFVEDIYKLLNNENNLTQFVNNAQDTYDLFSPNSAKKVLESVI